MREVQLFKLMVHAVDSHASSLKMLSSVLDFSLSHATTMSDHDRECLTACHQQIAMRSQEVQPIVKEMRAIMEMWAQEENTEGQDGD